MHQIANFLFEICKLKEKAKTGWVLMKIKNPETIADHTFRTAFGSWLLGAERNLKIGELIKISLVHDLSEVYAGDMTPFFYYEEAKKKEILMKWVRLSKEEKEKRGKEKFKREKTSLLRLIKDLNRGLKDEIFFYWLISEKMLTKETKFVKQFDRIETLLQAIEYFDANEEIGGTSWWEGTEERVEDPLLLEFLKILQNKFYERRIKNIEHKKELEAILEFLLKIGKLKRLPRLYWTLRKVKNPETVTGHIFTLAMMAWILGRQKKELNMEKLLKMALCHEISAVLTGDTTPYDLILPKEKRKRKKILENMLYLSKKEKEKIFKKEYQEERGAISKLTSKLRPPVKEEMDQLWKEYRTKSSPEGNFLNQLNALAVLMQALLYQKQNKKFQANPLWEWALEKCEDPICLEFLAELDKKFPKR